MVRVVGEEIETAVMSIQDALKLADSLELDLVEISPNADPLFAESLIIKSFFTNKKRNKRKLKLNRPR